MFEAYSETEDLKDILCDLVLHGVRRGTLCDFHWAFRSLLSLLEHIKRIGRTVWSRARPCLSDRSIQTHTHAGDRMGSSALGRKITGKVGTVSET